MDNFDPYNVAAIAANIPVLLKTAFVLQCHILYKKVSTVIHTTGGITVNCIIVNFLKLCIFNDVHD